VGRIIHLELTADDLDKVSRFYTDALGWRTEASPYADVRDPEGTVLGLREPA
jgi:predicted enzyme related to lactoylglutathione lyase